MSDDTGQTHLDPSTLGPNMWLIDEMYRRYRDDPDSVGTAWKEFFEDFRPALEPANDGGGGSTTGGAVGSRREDATGGTAGSLRPASPHPTPGSAIPTSSTEASPSLTPPAQPAGPSVPLEPSLRTEGPPATAERPSGTSGAASARPTALPEGAERIRFGAERVVKNMERSLEIPTATSFRFIPAKLLEENRRIINRFLAANR